MNYQEIITIEPGTPVDISGLRVTTQLQHHSGDSYGFRFEHGGRSVVYTTDSEHKLENRAQTEAVVGFFREADLVIFDAMYSLADTMSVKEDWGHSNNIVAVELAQAAHVKRLVLFHHEPVFDDTMIERILADTVRFEEISRHGEKIEVISAYDGLEITF